jgi:hypothetical protein
MVILSTIIDETDIENHYVYQKNKMISIQLNETSSAIKRENNNNKRSSIVNCYLKWDDRTEEKKYLERMHKEIIKMPVEETLKSLHKFGHLGYLREEDVYDSETYATKYLFSEAWSGDDSKKDGYCKVSSDVLKTRLPKAIKITIQREKLEDNKHKNKKTTRIEWQRQQKHQEEKEEYSPRVKSLKDFVQLFEQKEKEGKIPRVYVSY